MDSDSDLMLVLCSLVQLIRELGNINVKKKEPPFCYPYSLKARVLLLTHLSRMDVSENIEEGMHSHTPLKCQHLILQDNNTPTTCLKPFITFMHLAFIQKLSSNTLQVCVLPVN